MPHCIKTKVNKCKCVIVWSLQINIWENASKNTFKTIKYISSFRSGGDIWGGKEQISEAF